MSSPAGVDLIFEQMERELVPRQPLTLPGGMVYHYTDAFGLDGILRHGVVHATHYRFMNDRTELDEGRKLVLEACAELQASAELIGDQRTLVEGFREAFARPAVQDVTRDIFIASFSEKGDDLGQWRAYGNRGAGYAIGVRFVEGDPKDEPTDKQLGFLLRCEYERADAVEAFKADLLSFLNGFDHYATTFVRQTGHRAMWTRGMTFGLRRLARHWLSFKNSHFRDEAEWRFIGLASPSKRREQLKTKPSATRGTVPYVELTLSPTKPPPLEVEEIIVGPTHDPESGVLAVVLLLESLGYKPEDAERVVKRSAVPFRG